MTSKRSQPELKPKPLDAVVVLAVAAGATLCGVLLQTGAIRALGLTGIMLFELAWALPVWCVTLLTTRINR